MSKINLIKILSIISFVSFAVFLIMGILLIVNSMGSIFLSRRTEYVWYQNFNYEYYVLVEDTKTKVGIFVGLGLSLMLMALSWGAALFILFKFIGKNSLTPSMASWIIYGFPLSVFNLLFASRKRQKTVEQSYDSSSDYIQKLNDKLIYGEITPEEFEKQYTELLNKSKIEK